MFSKAFKGRAAIALILLGMALFLYWFNHGHEVIYGSKQEGIAFEKAKVMDITASNLEPDEKIKGLYRGTQQLTLRILTGAHKGETHSVTNYLSTQYNVHAKTGMKLIVNISTAGEGKTDTMLITVYSYNRAPLLYGLIGVFFLILCGIGGRKGLKSVISLAFTFACILFLFVPMLYRGYSPMLASVLTVALTVCLTMLLLDGWSAKALSAILGTTLGVVIAGSVSALAGSLVHLTGFNTNEAEALIIIAGDTGMQVRGLLFAGILITSLGAIMDVGISVASSVHEVFMNSPGLSRRALFQAGMNVGRDMMGTMANTLILAFTGASLTSLILLYSYNVPYNQLINMDFVATEIIQGIAGSIAVVLTVPIVALVSARIMPAAAARRHTPPAEAMEADLAG